MMSDFSLLKVISESFQSLCDKQNVARIGSIAVPLVFSFVVLFSLVGNILVLVFLPHSWHSQMYRLLCNLAISDLIFTAGLPFWSCQFIWGWTFGDVMCKGVSFVFSVGFYSSIVFMMMISLWQYLRVFHVFLMLTTFFRAATFLSWVISIALAVPALFQSSVVSDTDDPNRLYCMHNSNGAKLAATYQQNSLFVVAILLIGFCNIRVGQKLNLTKTLDRVRVYRFLRVILCIVIFFFIGWAPYNIVMFLQSRSYYHVNDFTDCNMSDNLDYALYVCTMLAFSHCCINPVLYVFTREIFWKRLSEILPCTEIPADAQQPQIAELNDD
uniref:G-protein coupled receptors family 1 profile domain-containing protein n=1 Tax=Astyanax mexicanus TaxID=7994 RepID=A0A8B9JQB3_ASTMX